MIKRPGERNDSTQTDAAIRWLQTNDAAQRGGNPNGTTGVGAHRSKAHTQSHSAGGSSTRSATDSLWIPRIARRAVVRIHARHAEGEFMQIRFADDRHPGTFQFVNDGSVL